MTSTSNTAFRSATATRHLRGRLSQHPRLPERGPLHPAAYRPSNLYSATNSFKMRSRCRRNDGVYLGLQIGAEHLYESRLPAHGSAAVDARPKAVGLGCRFAGREDPGVRRSLLFSTVPPPTVAVFPRIIGDSRFQSETLWAYELGYRPQATDRFSWDIAAFYNVYGGLARRRRPNVKPSLSADDIAHFPFAFTGRPIPMASN